MVFFLCGILAYDVGSADRVIVTSYSSSQPSDSSQLRFLISRSFPGDHDLTSPPQNPSSLHVARGRDSCFELFPISSLWGLSEEHLSFFFLLFDLLTFSLALFSSPNFSLLLKITDRASLNFLLCREVVLGTVVFSQFMEVSLRLPSHRPLLSEPATIRVELSFVARRRLLGIQMNRDGYLANLFLFFIIFLRAI